MSKVKDGGPAYPRTGFYAPDTAHTTYDSEPQAGMSLRDYLAAKAMAGMLANPQMDYAPLHDTTYEKVIKSAFRMADEMLAAREQQTN